jgi:signal recognition particle subunit SRP54
MSAEQAQSVSQRMQKGAFDFNDYLQQSQNVRRMGGMAGVLKLIPGTSFRARSNGDLAQFAVTVL